MSEIIKQKNLCNPINRIEVVNSFHMAYSDSYPFDHFESFEFFNTLCQLLKAIRESFLMLKADGTVYNTNLKFWNPPPLFDPVKSNLQPSGTVQVGH